MATNDTDYTPQTWTSGDPTTPLTGPRLEHFEAGLKHHNHPALTDAEAEGVGGSGDGVFWDKVPGDGLQVLRIKVGPFADFEWDLLPDGSLQTPAGFKLWPVAGVPGVGVGTAGDWALSDNGNMYFKALNSDPTPTAVWSIRFSSWGMLIDGSLVTPAGFKLWSVHGVPSNLVGANDDWAISDNGHIYFKSLNNDPTPTVVWSLVYWAMMPNGSLRTPAGFNLWSVASVPGAIGGDADWALSANGILYVKHLSNDPTPIEIWVQYGGGSTTGIAAGYLAHVEGAATLAPADFSHAEGNKAQAIIPASHAWAAGDLSGGAAEGIRVPLKPVQTTDATVTTLTDAKSHALNLADGCWAIQGFVAARRHDVVGTVSYWRFDALLESHAGSPTPVLRLIGSTVTMIYQDAAASTWAVTLDVDSGVDLRIRVAGQAAKTINWVCSFEGAFLQ